MSASQQHLSRQVYQSVYMQCTHVYTWPKCVHGYDDLYKETSINDTYISLPTIHHGGGVCGTPTPLHHAPQTSKKPHTLSS